jgi:hypothetical protein
MTNEGIYQIWRPENSPWSKWVKPVVFPFLSPGNYSRDEYSVQDWKILLQPDTAIIADLPGAEGVSAGIALARAGYLPVLVYNACPTGTGTFNSASAEFISIRNSEPVSPPVVVDMSSILTALCATSKELVSLNLSPQAPPAFILDANRGGSGVPYGPGWFDDPWFDNRSFVAPSDFPSADYFRSHRISQVILLQPTPDIHTDLLQVLLRLQRDGMTMAKQAPWKPWAPSPLTVKPPIFIISAWEWLRRKFDYRRDSFHGWFGRMVPPSSS